MTKKYFGSAALVFLLFAATMPASAWAGRTTGRNLDQSRYISIKQAENDTKIFQSRLEKLRQRTDSARSIRRSALTLPDLNGEIPSEPSDGVKQPDRDDQASEPAGPTNDPVADADAVDVTTAETVPEVKVPADEIANTGGNVEPVSPDVSVPDENIIQTGVAALEQSAFSAVNAYRQSKGLKALAWNDEIAAVARRHSQAMADGKVPFSHNGFDDRFLEIRTTLGISAMAENVAYNYGYDDPVAQAVAGWIKSQGHRENMEGNYQTSGLGVVKSDSGRYYLTQIFTR